MKKLKLTQESMKRLEPEQMQSLNGGYVDGWSCAGAVIGSIAITAGAAAITAGSAGAGTALAVFLIAKTGSIASIVGSCS